MHREDRTDDGLAVRLRDRPHFEAADLVDTEPAAVLGYLIELWHQGLQSILKQMSLGKILAQVQLWLRLAFTRDVHIGGPGKREEGSGALLFKYLTEEMVHALLLHGHLLLNQSAQPLHVLPAC